MYFSYVTSFFALPYSESLLQLGKKVLAVLLGRIYGIGAGLLSETCFTIYELCSALADHPADSERGQRLSKKHMHGGLLTTHAFLFSPLRRSNCPPWALSGSYLVLFIPVFSRKQRAVRVFWTQSERCDPASRESKLLLAFSGILHFL